MYLVSCSLMASVSACGVRLPAGSSPIRGMVILPSGLTTTVKAKSGSRQVLMNNTSSGPITYLFGSTETGRGSAGGFPGSGVTGGAVSAAGTGFGVSGLVWDVALQTPAK